MEIKTTGDFLNWLHQQYEAGREFPALGRAKTHVYRNRVTGGGVQGNLWLDRAYAEADVGFLEEKPGVLTVAVVPNGECSIDWTHKKRFPPDTPLEALLEAFPNGRNIGPMCGGKNHLTRQPTPPPPPRAPPGRVA